MACAACAPRFDVALFCTDGSAILYHVPTYQELVQSLVDIAPIAGTHVSGVAVARDGRQLSDTFTMRALRATGIQRVIALAPKEKANTYAPPCL